MTLQQEAYRRIDEMTDDGIRKLIDIIDKMKTMSVTGFKELDENTSTVSENVPLTKSEKMQRFMQSAGKIQIDAEAVRQLRERSMI